MARPNKLKEIEKARGKPLEQIIPPLVNRYGQEETARQLNVSQTTISDWLKDNHYINRPMWLKDVTPKERADIEAAAARVAAWEAAQDPEEEPT